MNNPTPPPARDGQPCIKPGCGKEPTAHVGWELGHLHTVVAEEQPMRRRLSLGPAVADATTTPPATCGRASATGKPCPDHVPAAFPDYYREYALHKTEELMGTLFPDPADGWAETPDGVEARQNIAKFVVGIIGDMAVHLTVPH